MGSIIRWFIAIVLILAILCIFYDPIRSNFTVAAGSQLEYADFISPTPGPFVCLVAGTHGNEPAGTHALSMMIAQGMMQPSAGHLRVIPIVNAWGINHNYRYKSYLGGDLNRQYDLNGANDWISKQVLALTTGADLVVDFHEGWGYHQCQPSSVGSSLSPSTFAPAHTLAAACVAAINTQLGLAGCKTFMVLQNESCKIPTTLGCYMQKNNRAYILVETTGQNDIQPLAVRMQEVQIIVQTVLAWMRTLPYK
jgi:predicted deacylase